MSTIHEFLCHDVRQLIFVFLCSHIVPKDAISLQLTSSGFYRAFASPLPIVSCGEEACSNTSPRSPREQAPPQSLAFIRHRGRSVLRQLRRGDRQGPLHDDGASSTPVPLNNVYLLDLKKHYDHLLADLEARREADELRRGGNFLFAHYQTADLREQMTLHLKEKIAIVRSLDRFDFPIPTASQQKMPNEEREVYRRWTAEVQDEEVHQHKLLIALRPVVFFLGIDEAIKLEKPKDVKKAFWTSILPRMKKITLEDIQPKASLPPGERAEAADRIYSIIGLTGYRKYEFEINPDGTWTGTLACAVSKWMMTILWWIEIKEKLPAEALAVDREWEPTRKEVCTQFDFLLSVSKMEEECRAVKHEVQELSKWVAATPQEH